MSRLTDSVVCVCVAAVLSAAARADDSILFSRDVLPILSDKCFVCHGPDAQDDDMLRLDSFDGATADRGGYRAIDPKSLGQSEVLKRIHSADDPMPPSDAEKQLSDRERQILTAWVQSGGQYSKHWAFVPPKKTQPPGDGNPIDAFIRRDLRREGIDLASRADPATLARRVALVLTGLPPEPEQLTRFLADKSPGAYERLVDELLASPRFGEQQARYWLDAVRYGDTHGLHLDNRRGIYPYRDWVVRAFNQDLPLDQFIRKQIAGDLLPNPSLEDLVATGYVRLNPSTGEGGAIPAEFQMKNNFDRVETLGTVFLGMSLTCARCHSHKYDPIPQTEYYRLLAYFNSTAEPAMDGNKYEYGPTVKVPANQAAWDEFDRLRDQTRALLADLAESSKESVLSTDAARQVGLDPLAALAPVVDPAGPFAEHERFKEAQKLHQKLTAAREAMTTTLVAKDLPKPRATFVLKRGEYDQPAGEPVAPGVLSVMSTAGTGEGNRSGLAEWLTSPDHPLVSRVLLNRIWQRVFGYGLVRTPEDFGLQGQYPTHPELLDWLAVDLREQNWSLKTSLRQMVTSRTFRQESAYRDDVDDPENRLYARGPGYRLDAEVLRDTGLWSSGLLDPTMGGEGVKPYQPSGMWQALAHPASNTKKYQRDKGERLYRRSLYVYWKRTSPHPMMTLFDAPDRESSCVRRSRTNTSVQSLGLLNETQRIEMARKLAERLVVERATDGERLGFLYSLLTCREPLEAELRACLTLLGSMRQRYSADAAAATALLSHGEAPVNESLPAAEIAAWTQVCATVLASDAVILLY